MKLEKSIYCCLARFRSLFTQLGNVFPEFFSHTSLYFMGHLLSFHKSFAFFVFHSNRISSKNKKACCSGYLTPVFIDYEKFKELLRRSSNKFSEGNPKSGILHVFFVAFPDVFFFHNKKPNISTNFNGFKTSFGVPR